MTPRKRTEGASRSGPISRRAILCTVASGGAVIGAGSVAVLGPGPVRFGYGGEAIAVEIRADGSGSLEDDGQSYGEYGYGGTRSDGQ